MSANPLEALFSSGTLVRLLSVFLPNPQDTYYQQELVELTGSTLRPVQLALDKLTAAGLVDSQRRGRQVFYRVVTSHPAYQPLRALFERTFALTDVLREALEPLAADIAVAFVYGSIAAGTDRADSDVDVLIVGVASRKAVASALGSGSEQLGREIGISLYTPDRFAEMVSRDDHFLMDVLAGPRIWLVGDERVLERLAG
jgi:predicted nucleotidyltransferase